MSWLRSLQTPHVIRSCLVDTLAISSAIVNYACCAYVIFVPQQAQGAQGRAC
jgi:hypothetical protein